MAVPVIAAIFIGGFVSAMGSMVGRALIALGVGYVAYSGIDVLLDGLKALALSNFSGVSAEVAGVLGALKIGTAINITFSAIASKFAINGVKNCVMNKMAVTK